MARPLKVLVTGANRGLGLEMVKQYMADGAEVLAVIRGEPSEELKKLNPRIYKCDLSDYRNIKLLKEQIGKEPLDIVINNAGVYPKAGKASDLTDEDCDVFVNGLITNVVSPLKLAGVLAENLLASPDGLKRMVFLTSKMGSIADNTSGGHYFYRSSKTALNMVCTSLSYEFPDIKVICMHPGWVRTDMGGPNGLIDAEESVKGIRKVIQSDVRSGIFTDYKGEEIPW